MEKGLDISLWDELTEEEIAISAEMAGRCAREARTAPSEDSAGTQLLVPLGLLGQDSNPLLMSMSLAATAVVTETLAAAGEIQGYTMCAVALKGTRGGRVHFQQRRACAIS